MAPIALFLLIFLIGSIGNGLQSCLANRGQRQRRRNRFLAMVNVLAANIKKRRVEKEINAQPVYNPQLVMNRDWSEYDKPSFDRMSNQWKLFDDIDS